MRAYYAFLIVAVSAFSISNANLSSTTGASPGVLTKQASGNKARSLRVDEGVGNDEERAKSDALEAYVNALLKIHPHDFKPNLLPKKILTGLRVESKIMDKLHGTVDHMIQLGFTLENMKIFLKNPAFVKSLKDDGISDDGVQMLLRLMKQKTQT